LRSIAAPPDRTEIRPVRPSDSIEALTDLLHRAYADLGAMGLNYTAVDQSTSVTAERIASGHCLVAVDASALIGTIVVQRARADSSCEFFRKAGVAIAHQFAVAPEYQKRGLGSRLLDCAEAWGRACEHREIAVDTAEPARHLISFYERRGYRHVGYVQWEGKVYRSVVMSKNL